MRGFQYLNILKNLLNSIFFFVNFINYYYCIFSRMNYRKRVYLFILLHLFTSALAECNNRRSNNAVEANDISGRLEAASIKTDIKASLGNNSAATAFTSTPSSWVADAVPSVPPLTPLPMGFPLPYGDGGGDAGGIVSGGGAAAESEPLSLVPPPPPIPEDAGASGDAAAIEVSTGGGGTSVSTSTSTSTRSQKLQQKV